MIDKHTRWSRTSVTVYQSTRRNIPEHLNLQQYGSKNVILASNRASFSYTLGFKAKFLTNNIYS